MDFENGSSLTNIKACRFINHTFLSDTVFTEKKFEMSQQSQASQSISGLIMRKGTDELKTGVFILPVLPLEKALCTKQQSR